MSIIILGFVFSPNLAHAIVPPTDLDWPDRKYFTVDSYPGPEGEKEYWEQYFVLKGEDWMEKQKNKMMQAYNEGRLKEWIQTQGHIGDRDHDRYVNNSNSNVWYYYWINEQIPHYDPEILPPSNATVEALKKCQEDTNVKSCYLLNEGILVDYQTQGDCLIATASFGSEMAPQVQMLREIRDDVVLKTYSGVLFMNGFNAAYYSFSPTIAELENENPVFKETVKIFITPMISALSIMTLAEEGSELQVIALGISTIGLVVGMYVVAPIVVGFKIQGRIKSRK